MIRREVVIGDCRLLLGDCLDILPTLGRVDAVVTDPPYGIDYGGLLSGKGDGKGGSDKNGWKSHSAPEWDRQRPSQEAFKLIMAAAPIQIIWGGNYFTDYLPPSMQWLVWDKVQRGFSLADCEFAWSSQQNASRVFSYARGNESGFAPRGADAPNAHPTQKPLGVMKWCLERLPAKCQTILDPYMGSGTTLVACVKLGKSGIGIEIDEGYFDIACERIRKAYAQPDMFIDRPAPATQEVLL